MKGYHLVKRFPLNSSGEAKMEPGWKPFAYTGDEGKEYVICRKWVRLEQSLSDLLRG